MSTTKTGIVEDALARHKRESALTDEEIFVLLEAFTRDKTCILEEDAMSLLRWAQHCKLLTHTLQLVLEGHARIEVEGDQVKVGRRQN